jgi:hypothetical protein
MLIIDVDNRANEEGRAISDSAFKYEMIAD